MLSGSRKAPWRCERERTGAHGVGPMIETTSDAFLGGALDVLQPRVGYRAGLDAVVLAAAVPDRARRFRVLDVGAGVGVAGLCVARRCPSAEVVLLENAPELVALARENALRNDLAARVGVLAAAVGAPWRTLAAAGLERESFDHVIANPPFHEDERGTRAASPLKAASHAMAAGGIEAWARLMAAAARPRGRVTIIHLPSALPALLAALDGRFGGLSVTPVHARDGETAMRVIVQASKGSRAPMRLLPGLIVHGRGREFTPALDAVLRSGAALSP